MRIIVLFICILGFISCDTIDKNQAIAVKQINGLYVYVLSEPRMQVEPLGEVRNDVIAQLDEATAGKRKLKHILKGITSTALNNVDFQQVIYQMTTLAKEQHPDAEALIFDSSLNSARVVKFRLPYPSSY